MYIFSLAPLSIVLYIFNVVIQILSLNRYRSSFARMSLISLGFVAVLLHGICLSHWMSLGGNQNLTLLNLFSAAIWLASLITLLVIIFRPVEILLIFIFPLAILSLICDMFFPSQFSSNLLLKDASFHIILSILTLAIIAVGGLIALLLAVAEHLLRYKPHLKLLQRLPPLESLESLLFQLVTLGFVFLNLVLITSMYSYYHLLFNHALLWQKTCLGIFAWLVFAVLLLGRFRFGWRGSKAIRYTGVGVFLLALTYFGSEMIERMLL